MIEARTLTIIASPGVEEDPEAGRPGMRKERDLLEFRS
jgi:hypothetical protein